MNCSQLFSIVKAGPAVWEVRHEITDELAGIIQRTPRGFVVRNDQRQQIGSFDSITSALQGLYEAA
ncbi:hypothetical protein E3T28_06705 [Cryobacterium sinapicolor]|uniref:Uncharacterized protein n=1 Tax=Cryobacterium sinapicolor TaxID=1259236 RepID=A0ABY2J906_9MICO|nr:MULTISPECIES: hypothetical protein [Cryobacterium]TFC85277.1 hypothetical protein E3O67_11885 [Cryobacterium sp. TMT3-29-2]TFD01433.1 hypothetical protein E3T28_06705 [Cryobacterium sinapicolor]